MVFHQKMYNGENGIQKYVCTLLAHFTEITLHTLLKYFKCNSALNIKLLEPLAQGASRFEKLLAPLKTHWPPIIQTT